jgi:anti-sigma factor RsiW
MNCRHARKMISRYVDDELRPEEKKDLDAHIRSCASCREELEETRVLNRLFASAQRFPAPYGFSTRVLASLQEKERRPFILRAAQVASVLVVMAIGIISGNLLLAERPANRGQAAVQETFSLDLFQATPPDSIGGIYNTLMRANHEK